MDSALLLVFNNWLQKDTSLFPVSINITEFTIIPHTNTGSSRDELKMNIRYQRLQDRQPVDFAFFTLNKALYKYMKEPVYFARICREEFPFFIQELNHFINNSFDSIAYRGIRMQPIIIADAGSHQDTVFYNDNRKLSWKDFKGKPDPASFSSSVTGAGFGYIVHPEIKAGWLVVSLFIKCFFLPQSSWVREEDATRYLLGHEQLHFDIAYLGSLKLKNAISTNNFSVGNYEKELDAVYQHIFLETQQLQLRYDLESKHGRKSKAGRAWQKKIHAMINENLPGKGGFLPGLIN
jgi:hypothetical protein